MAHDCNIDPESKMLTSRIIQGSLGTQIGVLSQIAPGRSGDVSRLAFSALIAGALSTLTSASIAVSDPFRARTHQLTLHRSENPVEEPPIAIGRPARSVCLDTSPLTLRL